jgi:hypothetical protein
MVERTPVQLNQLRRFTASGERRQEIRDAVVSLGCTLDRFNSLIRSRSTLYL